VPEHHPVAAPVAGFYGKLPSRGDFLRGALPRGFTDKWDAFLSAGMTASRAELGDVWLPSWMEAPIWFFALADDVCGPSACTGLFLPSVDRAGRHFPLTIALLYPGAAPDALAKAAAPWLAAAEQAGLDALEFTQEPEILAERLTAAPPPSPGVPQGNGGALFWTAGSPFVAPASWRQQGLPDPAGFARMLRDRGADPSAADMMAAS
jgi:type VI secretion system protein ImpM